MYATGEPSLSLSGGVRYHFNIARGLALILRGFPFPTLYFEIKAGVPHTYRLEVYGADYFEFRIDGVVMDSGKPEADFPAGVDPLFAWGARFYQSGHTTQWDYIRFGTIKIERIPTVSQWSMAVMALLIVTAGTIVLRQQTT